MADIGEVDVETLDYKAINRRIFESSAAGARIVLASLSQWDSSGQGELTPEPEPMPEGMDPVYWSHRQSQGCS